VTGVIFVHCIDLQKVRDLKTNLRNLRAKNDPQIKVQNED